MKNWLKQKDLNYQITRSSNDAQLHRHLRIHVHLNRAIIITLGIVLLASGGVSAHLLLSANHATEHSTTPKKPVGSTKNTTNPTGTTTGGTTTPTSTSTTKTPPGKTPSTSVTTPTTPPAITVPPGSAIAAVQADLRAALHATAWPVLNPDFSHPSSKDNHGCTVDKINPIAQCTWGNTSAPHTFYLVGDSTSAAYLPGFATFIDQIPSWKMVVRSDSGCPFSTDPEAEGDGADPKPPGGWQACIDHNNSVLAEIDQQKPDMVVFTSVSGAVANIGHKQDELTIIHKASPNTKIVVLPTSPAIKDPLGCKTNVSDCTNFPNGCFTAISKPSDCNTPIPPAYKTQWMTNFANVAKAENGTFIDVTDLFCADGQCPVFVRTIPKTDDGLHPTVDYSTYLGPAIHELFTMNNLLP